MNIDNHTPDDLIHALGDSLNFSELTTEEEVGSIETEEDYKKWTNKEKIYELHLSNRLKAEELESKSQDRLQRKEYADKIFMLLCFFLVFVGVFLFIAGLEMSPDGQECHFKLSDNVLITLLTTASANVIGIFILVARYLFNVPNTNEK
ncbi:hypothetical protein [Parabacteroides goldsteinii]|uniref:Uncharacterized protein n=1 Tax=Parabacteroides goldsteinii TaxID=328812 RepID=A0A6G1ZDP8_9BACT|nr:hypothetical protein [Parabacteroides goldsteinii]MRX93432.1 hypothetical protein [Parabacteroides goldsteinii]MRX95943.1 hypothetical protein [Parabacteroides goldsteinii]MRY05149.1 hypothetical protein [Parabacteroides goldsteinii]MRY12049.1 hypothetical protein [Parabacteroides goldsteinii]MRY23525.1 hypothetical protein [Parabacteroides goldsteinii]